MVFSLKVVAPATLEGGYSFDATVDGRTFRVRVPEGGVVAGEEFVVHDSQEIVVATKDTSNQEDAPRGHWRNNMFSFVDTMFTGTFWMAFFCPMIQTAQLLTRFNLDWLARDGKQETVHRTFVASMIVFLVFGGLFVFVPQPFMLYLIFYVIVQTRLRRNARRRYDIPGNVFIDFVRTLFCSCCSTMQMVRHTHDEKEYPYDGCAVDGLPLYAPPLPCTGMDASPSTKATAPSVSDNVTEVTVPATDV